MSDQSEEISPNMNALKMKLLKEGYSPEEALRAVTTKHYNIIHWIKTLKKIAEADYIFLDDHSQTTDWLTIKNTIITQLWHAGAGFKSTGYSRFGMPASPAPWSGHRQYTYGIAGSKKIRHFFSEVWGINDSQVLPTGMPRLDEFLDEEHKKEAIENITSHNSILCKQNRVILFAPTYRGENKRHAYYPYDMLDFDKLYKMCKDTDSVIIFKMHPFISEPVPIPENYRDRLTDMSDYPNINDLFYITDLLITDYSSNIYEFSLMRKPMLFFAYDIESYTKERGFHRDYRANVPGKITETFDDMIDAIYHEDFEYYKTTDYLKNNFDHIDTHACDRIIEWIIKGNLPENLE
jgi:CDP-ribitol ribitolphosphotransferase